MASDRTFSLSYLQMSLTFKQRERERADARATSGFDRKKMCLFLFEKTHLEAMDTEHEQSSSNDLPPHSVCRYISLLVTQRHTMNEQRYREDLKHGYGHFKWPDKRESTPQRFKRDV